MKSRPPIVPKPLFRLDLRSRKVAVNLTKQSAGFLKRGVFQFVRRSHAHPLQKSFKIIPCEMFCEQHTSVTEKSQRVQWK